MPSVSSRDRVLGENSSTWRWGYHESRHSMPCQCRGQTWCILCPGVHHSFTVEFPPLTLDSTLVWIIHGQVCKSTTEEASIWTQNIFWTDSTCYTHLYASDTRPATQLTWNCHPHVHQKLPHWAPQWPWYALLLQRGWLHGNRRHRCYCTISINSAGPVTCDGPAEILVSATSRSCRDMPKNLGIFEQFSAAGDEKNSILVIQLPNEFGTLWKSPWQLWHFSNLEGAMTRDCRIEWNGTVFNV